MKAIGRDVQIRSFSDNDSIHELIGLLYEAAMDFHRWPAFLSRLASVTDSGFATRVTREFGMETSTPGLIVMRRISQHDSKFDEVYSALRLHLRRALEMQRRFKEIETRQIALEDALNRLTTGVILLDSRLMVMFANSGAHRILVQKNGLILRDGMLAAQNKSDSVKLGQTLQEILGIVKPQRRNGVLWISRCGKKPIGVVTLRVESGNRLAAAVAVYISDPDSGMFPDPDLVRQLYQLTPAETALALQLLQGNRLEESAHALGISLNTARTHLKRALNKTDTRRQADLIRLLLTGPACLRL